MKKILLALFIGFFWQAVAQPKIKSPDEFLGYKLGSQFTYHYRLAEYFRYVAGASEQVKLQQYGLTNEGRPMLAMFIASPESISRLESIRKANLDLVNGRAQQGTGLPVIWLSFNVHGNEPSSSEAAMQTLYSLVNPANASSKKWLQNTVVVIDPCLNPDGRDRYVNFFNPAHSTPENADPQSREHREPWPGGRVSHYYFDLNRDWAWQTQKETQQRLALYSQWMPEVHVDFHEQGYNSPYYFAPAAEPMHKYITPWQKKIQEIIGKNNAKYFDQNGWLYFTKERFDLLYPSYGDTYPIYNGSIGMTYEQGGGPAGGLAVQTRDGDTLTLADRIAHHHSNALSTIETISANAQKVTDEFARYFTDSRSKPQGEYKAYVVKNTNPQQINRLAAMLARNNIAFGYGAPAANGFGFNYFNGKNERFKIEKADLVISTYQPKSVLLNVLFEPRTVMTDSNTYDITAWALPYAFGLKTYALKRDLKPASNKGPALFTQENLPDKPYAYAAEWNSVASVQFLAKLFKAGIKTRYIELPISANGKQIAAGSLLITRTANRNLDDKLDEQVRHLADSLHIGLHAITTGFSEKGNDLGSGKVHIIAKPRVMAVSGNGVSPGALGEVWQFFEQQIGYPLSVISADDLARINWGSYDVAIFPDGQYDYLNDERLQTWVKQGGKLIVMENAAAQLAGKKGFALEKAAEKKNDEKKDAQKEQYVTIKPYENRDREFLKLSIPGAVYRVDLDNTHPLGFGFPGYYFTLKLNDNIYPYFKDEGNWNVGTFKKDNYVSGFVGQNAKAKLKDGLVLGVQEMGRGTVVYLADDPLFRSFWESGKLLFSNAVFMVGN